MTQPKRLKSLRWLAFILLGMVLFCCGGGYTAFLVLKHSSERSLQEKLEQLASKGIPVDDASMAELHESLTSTENVSVWMGILDSLASPNYLNQCQNVPIVGENTNPIPKVGDPWADEELVERLISQNSEIMKLLLDIAQTNGPVRYPIQFKSFSTSVPYAESTQGVARLLMLEAILAARAGDADREFRAINAMIGCAISVRGEPCLVSQLISINVHGKAVDRLRSAVQANRLSAEQLGILRTRLAPFSDINESYRASLCGQIGSAIPLFRDPALVSAQVAVPSKFVTSSGMADRAARRYAERMEEALEIQTDNLQNFVADCEAWEKQPASGGTLDQMENSMSSFFMPALLSNIGNALVRSKMMNDLATLAIAARQFEKANGQLPKSLEELKTQGIDLNQFLCVDGNLPIYMVVDPASSGNSGSSAGSSSDSSASESVPPLPSDSSIASRAILWSFDPQKTTNNPKPSLSPTPPSKTINKAPLGETNSNWWRWDLQ